MTTHDAFGEAQWQWLKKMWINLHMGNGEHGEHFDDMLEELGGLGKWGTSSRQGNNEFC